MNSTSVESNQKKKNPGSRLTLVVLLICSLTGCLLYTNIAALLPQFAKENHPQLSGLAIGILFSSYQISFVASALFVRNYLHEFGRKRALYWSFLTITFSSFAFASAGWIKHDYGFYTLSITARLAQGLGESIFFIVCPSIIAQVYPEKIELYLGYTETFSALGYMLGPAIAAVLSRWTDYIGIQFVLGFIVIFVGTITVIVIPDDMDHDEDNEKESTINVSYLDFIKNKRVSMTFVMYFMNAIGFTFYEPILSIRLRSLGLAEENVAFGFIVLAAFEAIGSVIIGYMSKKIDKRIVIFGSFLFFSLSIYLTGGGAEESLVISFIGLSMVGFFQAGGTVPIIPEVIDLMQDQYSYEKYICKSKPKEWSEDSQPLLMDESTDQLSTDDEEPIVSDNEEQLQESMSIKPKQLQETNITDKASALAEMSYATGIMVGPVLGGAINDLKGFKYTTNVMGAVMLTSAFLYVLIVQNFPSSKKVPIRKS